MRPIRTHSQDVLAPPPSGKSQQCPKPVSCLRVAKPDMAHPVSWTWLSATMALLALLPRPALPGGGTLTRVGHNSAALPGMVQVVGDVGAGALDPAKLKHWVADQRQPLFAAAPGPHCNCAEPSCPTGGPCSATNIYSPQAVQLSGPHSWRLYFHGWDGVERNDRFDRIYMAETTDGFGAFVPHKLMVDHGVFANVGNENVLRVSPTDWRMAYTTLKGTPPTAKPTRLCTLHRRSLLVA